MRATVLVMLLGAGCGRYGFEPRVDGGGSVADANPDAAVEASGQYQVAWARQFGTLGQNHAYAVTSAPGGGVTLAGELGGPADFGGGPLPVTGFSVFAASLDATGAHRWSRAFGGSTTGALALTSDPAGVYLTAGFSGTISFGGATFMAVSDKPFVAALDHDGNHRWSYRANGAFIMSTSIAVGGGLVAITGNGDGTIWNFGGADLPSTSTSIDMFAAAYRTSDGAHVWSRRLFDPAGDFVEGEAVSARADGGMRFVGVVGGNIDVGGTVLTGGFDQDALFVEYDPAGTHASSRRFGSPANDRARRIATHGDGGVIVLGDLGGPADLGGGVLDGGTAATFLAAFDATTAHRWSRVFAGRLGDASLVVTPAFTHLAATFSGTIDLGDGPLVSAGGTDLVVATFDDTGTLVWAERFGGAGDERAGGLTRTDDGALYLAGSFEATITVGGTTLTCQAASDTLVLALTPVPTAAP